MNTLPSLVDTAWLSDNLDREDICVLDCSWHMPNTNRSGQQEYLQRHIPGSHFFDIDEVSDTASPLPHMLPKEQVFSDKVSALGITNSTHIIVYDVHGLFSAARVWWMFRVFGHENVSILNGGFKKWMAEGLPISSTLTPPVPTEPFQARLKEERVVTYNQLLDHINNETAFILDARSQGRFDGIDPEPRVGLVSGHMPGSTCLPFVKLLDEYGCVRPKDELEDVYNAAGFNNQDLVITSCGSGVTAAILIFGLHLIGYDDAKLYDGSWSEYADVKSSVIL